jgi:pimeloyl-[acyl-carrier protein] methyl ester esterase
MNKIIKQQNLITIPGWGMEPCVWNPIMQGLNHFFKLYHIRWEKVRSVSDFKQNVLNIIIQNNLKSFSILSWSMGSIIALDIANEYKDAVPTLILFGATSCFTTKRNEGYNCGWPESIIKKMKSKLQQNQEKTVTDFYLSMFSETEKEQKFHNNFLEIAINEFKCMDSSSLLSGLDYLIESDFRKAVRNIKSSMLIISGEEDKICPPDASLYLCQNSGGECILKRLPQTGHMPFFTKPQKCIELIDNYLSGNDITND